MARSKKTIDKKFFAPFPTRLRQLMEERGDTQENIATVVNKSRQTVSQYCNGVSEPGYDALTQLAKYFCVSVDYLLGVSDVKSRDTTVQNIAQYTGLSEEAIHTLSLRKSVGDDGMIKTINVLIEQASAEIYAKGYNLPKKGKHIDGYCLGYDNGYTWKYRTYNRVLRFIGEYLAVSRSFDIQNTIQISSDGKILSGFSVDDEEKLLSDYQDDSDTNLVLYRFGDLYCHELIEKIWMDRIANALGELKAEQEAVNGND